MPDDAPQMVDAISPDGKPFKLPVENIAKAKAAGWQVSDPRESLGSELGTAAEGFAQGLIPGAATAEATLLPNVGSIEEQKARREANPGFRGVGNFLGVGAQAAGVAALTGGLGEIGEAGSLAEKLAEGAEIISPATKATEAVEAGVPAAEAAAGAGASPGAVSAAADATLAQAPTSAAEAGEQAVARAGANYGGQAAAGAAMGGTQNINEAELGDHDFNGESLLMDMGLGAATNVAAEFGLHALRHTILPPVIDQAGKLADAAKEKLGDLWVKAVETINPETAGKVRPAMEAIQSGATKFTDTQAEQLGTTMNDLGAAAEKMGKAHETQFRPGEVERNLENVPRTQVLGSPPGEDGAVGVLKLHAGLEQEMGRIEQLYKSKSYKGNLPFNVSKDALDQLGATIHNPEATTVDIHNALRKFTQDVADSGIFDRTVKNTSQQAAVDDITHNIWAPVKDALNDKELFGAAQAERNGRLDAVTTRKINTAKQVARDFGASEIDLDSGKKELYIKPSKLKAVLTGDPLSNKEKLEHLSEYFDAMKEYTDEVGKSAGTAGAVVPGGDDIRALLESVTNQRAAAESAGAVTQLARASGRGADTATGLGVAGLGAHALGLSVPGAGAVAAAYGALKDPVRTMEMFAKVSNAAAAAKKVIATGVRRTFSSDVGRAAVTSSVASAIRGRTVRSQDGASAGNDFHKQEKHITELAGDQQRQLNALQQNTSRLNDVAPLTTMSTQQTALRLSAKLYELLPKNPAPSLLPSDNKDWMPPATQLAIWDDQHAALLHPPRFIDQLADGTADPATWQALNEVYPKWSDQLKQAVIQHMSDHPALELSQAQRYSASLILGQPVAPSVSPDQIAYQQQTYTKDASTGIAGGIPKQKSTQHGMDKIDLGTRSALGPASRRR